MVREISYLHKNLECGGNDAALDSDQMPRSALIQSAVAASLCRRTPKARQLYTIRLTKQQPKMYIDQTFSAMSETRKPLNIVCFATFFKGGDFMRECKAQGGNITL